METILPKRKYILSQIFLLIWFFAWGKAFSISDSNTITIILIIFIVPILFFAYVFLYNLFGKEVVRFDDKHFIVAKRLFFYSNEKKYKFCNIDTFMFSEEKNFLGFAKDYVINWGLFGGNIRFNYENNSKRFGVGVYDFEAKSIVKELNIKLEYLKNKNCV